LYAIVLHYHFLLNQTNSFTTSFFNESIFEIQQRK
jgi:hypothetical protein